MLLVASFTVLFVHILNMLPYQISCCLTNVGDKAEALDWYSKGVAKLEDGIAMETNASGIYTSLYVM